MTNSSVKKVRNGFIRVEAIVPCAVVTGVIVAYSMLFFDGHLRKAIEWGATQANGAEVNVARVKTSFLSASIVVGGIQVTNSAEPKFNRLAIGEGRFKLSWDALLRAKIVIDEAAIEQVEIGTQRAKPGFVVPPSPPSGAFARIKDRITRSALGEAGQLLEGFDPMRQLTNVRADLKSEARVKELQSQFGAKEAQWTGAAKNLADGKEFSALQQRLQAVPTSVGNPAEIPGRVAEVNGIIKDVDAKISSVRAQGDQLLKEVNVFGSSISELDDLIKADKDGLEKLLKLPTLDARGIAEQLFGAKA